MTLLLLALNLLIIFQSGILAVSLLCSYLVGYWQRLSKTMLVSNCGIYPPSGLKSVKFVCSSDWRSLVPLTSKLSEAWVEGGPCVSFGCSCSVKIWYARERKPLVVLPPCSTSTWDGIGFFGHQWLQRFVVGLHHPIDHAPPPSSFLLLQRLMRRRQ